MQPCVGVSGWFTAEGLTHLREVMTGHVTRGDMPGLIALVARGQRAHVEVMGTKAFGDGEPMQRDAVFRIASLTKPVAAAAAMTLVDDGTLHLEAPVDDLLPELANRRVLRSIESQLSDTVAAARPITLDDVLTFRLGFGAIMAPPNTYPIQAAEAELELHIMEPPWPPFLETPDEWLSRLGSLPLIHQPGEKWMYNAGAWVLGALLERATGKPLEAVLRERVLDPLGMSDTTFTITPQMHDRLTTAYAPDPHTGKLAVLDSIEGSYWSRALPFPTASAWLLSTIDDFWRFVQMMLNRGVFDGHRVLSEQAVTLMTSDHLTRAQRDAAPLFFGEASSWGLGMAVPAAGVASSAIPRGFGWDGGTGTTWRSDVESDLTGILFTQRAMTSPQAPQVFDDFWMCAYAALDD